MVSNACSKCKQTVHTCVRARRYIVNNNMTATTVRKKIIIVRFLFQKQIVLHETIYCFQHSWVFLKFYETLHVYSNQNFYVCNSGQKVKLQVKFPVKKNQPDCRHRWLDMYSTAIMLMDILKQAIAKNWQVEFKRPAKEQKQWEAPWDFVYTLSCIKHSFTQCSCYFGCDR